MAKNYKNIQKSEWSYLVSIDEIDETPKTYSFSAEEGERADLARRLHVVSVKNAKADVTLQRLPGGMVHAMGSVRADVIQNCVVTAEEIENHIEDQFEGWFGEPGRAVSFARAKSERDAKKGHVEAEILEESVDPEPIIGGKVDIGELATQYLSLAVDPYPRKEGAASEYVLNAPEGGGEGASLRKNPFEALKAWKEGR
jgi:hypothetical protein